MFLSQKKKTWSEVPDWLLDLVQLTQFPRLMQLSSRLYIGLQLSLRVRIESELEEVGSCVGHTLLMLEVEMREYHIKSELHGS